MREIFLNIYNIWITERPSQLAAALAYFGMFSFAPVIFLGFTVAGLFVDRLVAAEHLFHSLDASLGSETSNKILPDLEIAWRDVWMGSLISAFLIWRFTLLFRLYLDSGLIGSAFVAGAFSVLLIVIYNLAQIILFGAVCCRLCWTFWFTMLSRMKIVYPGSEYLRKMACLI